MTRDDIINIGYEADAYANGEWDVEAPSRDWKRLRDEHFAALVAAAEREDCAKLCEATPYLRTTLGGRSRAEVEGGLLAEAIRARSQL
jgi:hypothetical protein